MHDRNTRASHRRHHRRRGIAAAVMAVFVSAMAVSPSPMTSAEASDNAGHRPQPVALELVPPGREGMELSARLTEDGAILQSGLSWTVTRADGQPVFSGEAGMVDLSVPPGDYQVDLHYGAATLSRSISLPDASRLVAGFVLEAGGLQVTASPGVDGAAGLTPRVRVFALDGDTQGRLMAVSAAPGEIIRLPSGSYRVESRLGEGNAVAVADVTVSAGILRKVRIGHKAGLARLSFVGAPTARVTWRVADAGGTAVARSEGLNVQAVLRPGNYVAIADTGPEELTARFTISGGETRDIMLGN